MKTPEEIHAYIEIALLSEATRDLVKSRLRDHLLFIIHHEGKEKQDAVDDMINDFKKIGLA